MYDYTVLLNIEMKIKTEIMSCEILDRVITIFFRALEKNKIRIGIYENDCVCTRCRTH